MKKQYFIYLVFVLTATLIFFDSCKKNPPVDTEPSTPEGTSFIEPSIQRTGDPTAGYDYLVNGNYVSSGIPFTIFKAVFGDDNENLLGRSGDNATIAPNYTAVVHENGQKIVVGNCMQCHAEKINGDYIVGLGNNTLNFTEDQSGLIPLIDAAINTFYGPPPNDQYEAYEAFRDAILAVGPHLITNARGVNTADMLGAVLASHRDRDDLTWSNTPLLPIPPIEETAPTDVPAWWLLKKKNAMFYAGVGRGDFSKFLMASSLLTLKDTSEARAVDAYFGDVLAFINSIEPPTYPESIDMVKAEEGKAIFNNSCASCHGTYGGSETYPNLLVDIDKVQTDSLLATANFSSNQFVGWYNSSWFAKGEPTRRGELVSGRGYIAPPLDGIWATAPYLHNGSVPTLADLLNSSQRPTYWKRTFDSMDIDFEKVGWNYSVETSQTDIETYDTTVPGYGNQGHYFGDGFTEVERGALIEYLKTL